MRDQMEGVAAASEGEMAELAMRFQAPDINMNKMIGLLGIADLAKEFRSSANGLKDAPHALMDSFWTPSYHIPYPRPGFSRKV